MIKERYIRNLNAISEEEQLKLLESKVCVIGCGGLGGFVIEILARMGIGTITAVDGDVFEESNLNRQLLSEMDLVGEKKALAAQKRVSRINPDVNIIPITEFVDEKNGRGIIEGHDIVVDALDNPDDRILLKNLCEECDITMIHGAIGGWFGQVSVVRPGDTVIEKIYGKVNDMGKDTMGNPSFIPATIASIEVSECIKVLLGKGETLTNKVLCINLLENEFDIIEF